MSAHEQLQRLDRPQRKIGNVFTSELVASIIREDGDIDSILDSMAETAERVAEQIDGVDGAEIHGLGSGGIVVAVKRCPTEPVLKKVIDENFVHTGDRDVPEFYDRILKRHFERKRGAVAAINPLCILCQAMRDEKGFEEGYLTTQIACKSKLTGDISISDEGIQTAGLTIEKTCGILDKNACLFHRRKI
ncbi:MAG: hypothetical protein NUW37_13085 [Planctomycetes bacterium]|nr:hypothetical protein [Planctomycetota bacterium]